MQREFILPCHLWSKFPQDPLGGLPVLHCVPGSSIIPNLTHTGLTIQRERERKRERGGGERRVGRKWKGNVGKVGKEVGERVVRGGGVAPQEDRVNSSVEYAIKENTHVIEALYDPKSQ